MAVSGRPVRWRQTLGDGIQDPDFQPTVTRSEDRLVASFRGKLYALDAASGKQLWESEHGMSLPLGSDVQHRPPVAIGSNIYTVRKKAPDPPTLYALDGGTGKLLWQFQGQGARDIPLMPTGADGTVYYSCVEALYAFDAATGRERWRLPAHDAPLGYPPATVSKGTLYVSIVSPDLRTGNANRLVAVDATTGRVLRIGPAQKNDVDNLLWPMVPGDGVFYLYANGDLSAIDATTGASRWSADKSSILGVSPVFTDRSIIGLGQHGDRRYLRSFDKATGAAQGDWPLSVGPFEEGPAAGDGVVYAGGKGGLVAIDATTGAQRWKLDAGAKKVHGPVVGNGLVYTFIDNDDAVDGAAHLFAVEA
jgi:outer membrane protein assembly factor BamB